LGWCITGHSRFSLSDFFCSFSILFSRCTFNASHYLQREAAHGTPDFYRVYRWALSIFLSLLSVPENACRFPSQKVWTFDFKKSRIKAYLFFSFYVTGFKASSVMNHDDLWVDLKQASSCLLIETKVFFYAFFGCRVGCSINKICCFRLLWQKTRT